jgi:hypothetical protein
VLSVTGLRKRPELNGRLATVVAHDAERNRYSVLVDGARVVLREGALRRTARGSSAAKKGLPSRPTSKAASATVRTARMSTVAPNGGTREVHKVPLLKPGAGKKTDRHLKDPLPWREHGDVIA